MPVTTCGVNTGERVALRLRRVCLGWPPDRFATLVADVVRFHERWDARVGSARGA